MPAPRIRSATKPDFPQNVSSHSCFSKTYHMPVRGIIYTPMPDFSKIYLKPLPGISTGPSGVFFHYTSYSCTWELSVSYGLQWGWLPIFTVSQFRLKWDKLPIPPYVGWAPHSALFGVGSHFICQMSVPNLYILPYVGWAPNDALCGLPMTPYVGWSPNDALCEWTPIPPYLG